MVLARSILLRTLVDTPWLRSNLNSCICEQTLAKKVKVLGVDAFGDNSRLFRIFGENVYLAAGNG